MERNDEITVKDKFVQCLTFKIGNTIYGIDVMRAKEVLYLIDITEVPNKMPFMKGVIDLRGSIAPVIDTRIKFNMKQKDYNDDTVIVIIEYENTIIGMIVDSVLDVLNISLDEIHDSIQFSDEINRDYVRGISKTDDMLIILLDVDKIFSDEEINCISNKISA